jgi:hypothetical protein
MQVSPLQLLTPFGEVGHLAQAVPQAVRLLASTQTPSQGFWPGSHRSSLHIAVSSMQAFRHLRLP